MNSGKNLVYIHTCACHRRELDAKKISKYLILNDYKIIDNPQKADFIIFFTCGFVNEIADRCFNIIKKFQNYNSELIVAGCLPDIEKEKLSEIFRGKIIPAKKMEQIDKIFQSKIKFNDIDDENVLWRNKNPLGINYKISNFIKNLLDNSKFFRFIYTNIFRKTISINRGLESLLFPEFSDRFIIMVSRGCTKNCSYCAIKKAIGPLVSKNIDACVSEFKKGLKQGYKKFVITADDVGAYGRDIGVTFPELLDEITKINGDYEIEIQGLNPVWVVKYIDDLESIIKRGKINIIISPIQSGSKRILKLMLRYYDTEKMIESLKRLKKPYPKLSLQTNYLVGFPTETWGDVENTISFIENVNFDEIYIFPFSLKEGTKAEKIEPKIKKSEIKKRLIYVQNHFKNSDIKVYLIS